MRESHRCPSPRSPASFQERLLPTSLVSQLSAAVAHPHRSAVASKSRPPVAVPPCETVSEEAATPGLPATLSRFGNLSSMSFDSAHADPEATAAEPALRDHWQRDIHACSESTLSHPETLRNHKLHTRCANPVDVEDCLWKGAEKVEEIRDTRSRMVRGGDRSYQGTSSDAPKDDSD